MAKKETFTETLIYGGIGGLAFYFLWPLYIIIYILALTKNTTEK